MAIELPAGRVENGLLEPQSGATTNSRGREP